MAMTKQEVFDKVVTHLVRQGRQSVDGIGCAYRGEDSTMCAVGCLIEDKFYNGRLEGLLVNNMSVQIALVKSGVISQSQTDEDSEIVSMLIALQCIHDNSRSFDRNGFVLDSVNTVCTTYDVKIPTALLTSQGA